MLRAAIVGMGWWGQNLVKSSQGKGDVQFIAGTTRTLGKAEDFAREQNIRIVADFDAVLADPDVEAVVLATPHSQHGAQVRRAAAAGKHVFCEKPFTLTAADAEGAIAAAEGAGIVLAVGFNRRFHPNMAELRARVRDGRLGDIVTCIGEQSAFANYVYSSGDETWRATAEEAPAGAMTGIGIHTVDSMIGLFGRVLDVHAVASQRHAPHILDTTNVLLRFEAGLAATIFCSYVTAPNYRLAVYGSKGIAEILTPTLGEFRFTPAPASESEVPAAILQRPGFNMLEAELSAFAAAVRGTAPYPVPLAEVLHGVQVFDAIVRSAAEGRPVAVG